jgi:hypothetical protein
MLASVGWAGVSLEAEYGSGLAAELGRYGR